MSPNISRSHGATYPVVSTSSAQSVLAVIDAATPRPDLLVAGANPEAVIVQLSGSTGVDQIAAALADTDQPVDELHLVSHGAPGQLTIGGETLDARALAERGRHWRRYLAPDAIIVLYGCSAGHGTGGRRFVQGLARATGARVFASSTPTGAAARGGDWKFDVFSAPAGHKNAGAHAPASAFSRAHDTWPGLLTNVTNTLDTGANSFRAAAGSNNIDFTGLGGAQTLTLASAVTLNSGVNTSLLLSGGTTNLTIDGSDIALALSNNYLTIGGTGGPLTLTINSNITGSGLLRIGDGDDDLTVVLGGTNSMVKTTGGVGNTAAPVSIRVEDGDTVSISDDAALGSGKLSLNDGTLAITGATTINNEIHLDNLISTINNSADVTISGAVTGTGGLIKTGASTLTLTGTNVYQDTTTITNGTLSVTGDANLGNSNDAIIFNGGNLTVTGATTIDNTVTLTSNATITNSADVTLSGVISSTGNLTKAGANTLTLSGVNTYTGTTTVTDGTLSVSADSKLGTGALTLNGGNLTVTGATTIDNTVTLSSNATVTNSADATLSGVISGANTLTKAGASTLTLAGTTSYPGTTTVTDGTLSVSADSNLGNTTGALTLNGGNLAITGATTIDNTVTLSSNATVTNSANATLSGVISGGNNLTKAGANTLTLTGTNTYTGTTTVNAGTLSVNGALNGGGTLTVASGGTLAGSGSITGDVTVASGGSLTPGNSPGILSTGNLTLSAGSTTTFELNGTTAGTQYDQIDVTGTVDVTGATLSTAVGFTPANGNVFTLIDNDGADAITGTFTGLAEGSSFTSSGRTFQISYTAGDGNDVTLTDITPVPATPGSGSDSGTIVGTSGADSLTGGNGAGTISALAGDDTLYGYDGNDTLYGGTGAALFYGNQANELIYGNQGSDTLFGGQNADTIFGGQDTDILYGNRGADVVYGNRGNDTLHGGQEADTLYGGQGDDSLAGNSGNDLLFGNLGADTFTFHFGDGNDTVSGYSAAEGDVIQFDAGTNVTSAATETGLTLTAGDVTVSLIGVAKIEDVNILFA